MVRNKNAKSAVLGIAVVALGLMLIPQDTRVLFGIGKEHAGITNRFLYSWLHVGIIHAAMNIWCMISIVFLFPVSVRKILTGFCIMALIPECLLYSSEPTIGMSGVCYFLLGSLSFNVKRKWIWQLWMWSFLILSIVVPGINSSVHAWGYITGVLYGALRFRGVKSDNEESREIH